MVYPFQLLETSCENQEILIRKNTRGVSGSHSNMKWEHNALLAEIHVEFILRCGFSVAGLTRLS
jgi:hypothetical protein